MRYGEASALLAGDVMLVRAYEYLNTTRVDTLRRTLQVFNRTGKEVCEGQQMDMDYEQAVSVSLNDYLKMIELKTAVTAGCQFATRCHHCRSFGSRPAAPLSIWD